MVSGRDVLLAAATVCGMMLLRSGVLPCRIEVFLTRSFLILSFQLAPYAHVADCIGIHCNGILSCALAAL